MGDIKCEKKAVELTPQQLAVVQDRGGDLLVSAAAGSGKTKVLVDRIVSRVCDEGFDITKFVVITFTKAAAAELRVRISAELGKRLAEDPGNRHIQRQMGLIYAANISTVHAFCGNLLRSNAAVLGIPSDFRVGEEQECAVLRAAAMEDMLESIYKTIDRHPNVKAFVDELAYGRDDSAVPAILYNVFETVQSHPWPSKWVEQCLSSMEVSRYSDVAETPWGAYIMENAKEHVLAHIRLLDEAQDVCDGEPVLADAFNDALAQDRARMQGILACRTWDEMYEAGKKEGAYKWGRQKPIKRGTAYSAASKEYVSGLRNRYKKAVDSRMDNFDGASRDILHDLRLTAPSIRGMFELMGAFNERYRARKESHNLLDFSDLEHETIRLLLDEETGERTEVAETLMGKYTEILVDEYQDTNAVQETIFAAISKNNLCMVGDVKQSIYMFRLADPTIFLRHYHSYKSHLEAEDGEPRKILLTKNFRSRPEILQATNDVMSMCMSPAVGGVHYGADEELVPGRDDFDLVVESVVELAAIDMSGAGKEAPSDDSSEDEAVETVAKADVEARYVARRIQDMLRSETIFDDALGARRPVKASDIAILMRSTRNSARHYVAALSELGIASTSARSGSIMDTTEVATLYAYLQVIDNPTQDIPLVAVLASPLVGFTADKLAKMRMAKPDSRTFFGALQAYAKEDKMSEAFLAQLRDLRRKAPRTKLSTLFDEIVYQTDAEDVFGSLQNGDMRMANVQKFREMIVGYENGGAYGLFSFICHIEALREQGAELPQVSCVNAEDAVTIMSVHASKGLEFPVVFLSDLSRRFNASDLKDSALLHRELGAGVQVMDKELMYRYPTVARKAIALATAAENKSEELRILYVAMTRAKQKLVMTYCDKLKRTLPRLLELVETPLPPHVSQAASNPGEWIMLTALARPESAPLWELGGKVMLYAEPCVMPWHITCLDADDIGGDTYTMEELERSISMDESAAADTLFEEPYKPFDLEQIVKDMEFQYKHEKATETKAKAVASALYTETKVHIRRPSFAKKAGFTAAERGTVTHAFMRYANYARCRSEGMDGIKGEINRLVGGGFILEQDKGAIMTAALHTLFSSDVGLELAHLPPASVKREFPFTLLVPAEKLLKPEDVPEDDVLLLQGIVDLHAVTDEGIYLYDFKTDFVASTEDEAKHAERYRRQMEIYADALEEIYHKPVVRRDIIFLRTGHKVAIA